LAYPLLLSKKGSDFGAKPKFKKRKRRKIK
jgi:hypothetical protein